MRLEGLKSYPPTSDFLTNERLKLRPAPHKIKYLSPPPSCWELGN